MLDIVYTFTVYSSNVYAKYVAGKTKFIDVHIYLYVNDKRMFLCMYIFSITHGYYFKVYYLYMIKYLTLTSV